MTLPGRRALGKILQTGLLPNLINDRLDPEAAVEATLAAGVSAIEISCRRPDTIALLGRLKRSFPGVAFGVCSLIEDGPYFDFLQQRGPRFPSIDEAVDGGADFLVSMIAFSERTYRRHAHLPLIPGVDSADHAKRQLDLGAALVKFSFITPAVVRTINSGPMHFGLPMLVTGGVRPEHVDAYVAGGVLACACGFDLIVRDHYRALQESFDADIVRRSVADYVEALAQARTKHRPNADFSSADPALIQRQTGQFMNLSLSPAVANAATEPIASR